MRMVFLVYEVENFSDSELFRRLESLGHNVNSLLFADTRDGFKDFLESESVVPQDVLETTNGNLELFLAADKGSQSIDGVLEDPRPGAVVLVYDSRKLNSGKKIRAKPIPGCEESLFYYARNASHLEEALVAAIKFI